MPLPFPVQPDRQPATPPAQPGLFLVAKRDPASPSATRRKGKAQRLSLREPHVATLVCGFAAAAAPLAWMAHAILQRFHIL